MSISVSRRGSLAAASVLVAVVLVVVVHYAGSDVRLSAPSYSSDPVPKATALSEHDLPGQCGVGKAALGRYYGATGDPLSRGEAVNGAYVVAVAAVAAVRP